METIISQYDTVLHRSAGRRFKVKMCNRDFTDTTNFWRIVLEGQAGRLGMDVTEGGKRQNYFGVNYSIVKEFPSTEALSA